MVVIEAVPNSRQNDPKTKPKSSTGVDSSLNTATVSGYASDGFETASDTELNDGEDQYGDRNKNMNADTDHGKNEQQQLREEQSIAPNDDELKLEEALAQASGAKTKGNKLFGDGQYEEALLQYELALHAAQDMPLAAEIRSIVHANCGTCFFKMGKYEETIRECTKALELNSTYIKALIRRGEAHEKLEHYEEAIADMTKVLELDQSHNQARRSAIRLKPLAEEKREKMKEEMIGKLKDMGNSILGRFGMSVDNFKAVKDPNTGSYSISFQR